MNHSFSVEIAEKYGIEKAVLLENFYFWVRKNKANKKNVHEGKVYTYNTAEAFAELFPYIKKRKIAQLLREMEYEDNLLISGQFNNYDRTKSYTLTDKAISFFESSIIQKSDNGTSKKRTLEDTKSEHSLNTDINTVINSDINTVNKAKKPCGEHQQVYDHYLKNYDTLYQQGKLFTNKVEIEYPKCGALLKRLLPKYSLDELFTVIDRAMSDTFILGGGYNLSVILSANQLNKLLNAKPQQNQQYKNFDKQAVVEKDFFSQQ
jgi:hypothetical protein